ncbi:PPE domain-containing protein [Mycolicibacterium houstonense]|uniref:PPE domain-containing protein n=1 Tax=Mycolicibacterium houstonense TaxID=146021 RepID=UPI003F9B7660
MADTPHTFVKVRAETLTAKAEELTGAWPSVPAAPVAPCQLHVASQGVEIIRASRDRLEGVIKAGEAEAKRLAECLRAAATAYQTIEDHNTASVDRTMGGGGGSPAPSAESVSVNPNLPPSAPAPIGQNPAKPQPGNNEDWANAVDQIAATDQGASLRTFAEGLDKLAGDLKEHAAKFSMGNVSWEGAAAEAAEGALRRHESWIYEVVAKAEALAKETRKLDDVHIAERVAHPDEAAKKFFFNQPLDWQVANYEGYQNRSSESQTRYANGASLLDVYAPDPPDGAYPATPVKAGDVAASPQAPGNPGGPAGGGPGGGGPGGGEPSAGQPANEPSVSPASAKPGEGEPKSGAGSPSGEGGSPAGGGGSPAGGGSPSGSGSGLPTSRSDTPGLPSLDEPSLAPASSAGSSGGGSGGGGGGTPASPLGPATAAETVAASPATRGPGGPAAPPGASGGMGGMAGGMGGMGGGHGQGQGGKEKRRDPNLAPDENLYVEDREYTEGVIGLQSRRKRTPQEGKGE